MNAAHEKLQSALNQRKRQMDQQQLVQQLSGMQQLQQQQPGDTATQLLQQQQQQPTLQQAQTALTPLQQALGGNDTATPQPQPPTPNSKNLLGITVDGGKGSSACEIKTEHGDKDIKIEPVTSVSVKQECNMGGKKEPIDSENTDSSAGKLDIKQEGEGIDVKMEMKTADGGKVEIKQEREHPEESSNGGAGSSKDNIVGTIKTEGAAALASGSGGASTQIASGEDVKRVKKGEILRSWHRVSYSTVHSTIP